MNRERSQARELALQCLYQLDLRGLEAEDSARALLAAAGPEIQAYARTLVEGIRARQEDLIKTLSPLVEHWSWERVAAVDRAILKIGAFEILHVPEVPPKVALDEAIELAKRYSTRESGAFVNGILDKIYRQRPADAAPAAS